MAENDEGFRVGWASVDLTPPWPVILAGQFYARASERVRDPISATVMAFESIRPGDETVRGVLVSCDLVGISDDLSQAVRGLLSERLQELDPMCVVFNATHTHTAPDARKRDSGEAIPPHFGVERSELVGGAAGDYVDLAADRIATAVVKAWGAREPAGIGYGLGHATIGYNRRICYYTGETRMYGKLDDPEFSHVEGGAETGINVLGVWNGRKELTGVIVNLACPSQVSEHEFQVSADYWCEARQELRKRLGEGAFILPQVSAAGDVTPPRVTTVPDWKALERMWRLKGIDERRDIGIRIAEAVAPVVELAAREIDWNPIAGHRVEHVSLLMRPLSEQDVADANAEAAKCEARYKEHRQALEANPQLRQDPHWYVGITGNYRMMQWNLNVARRYAQQQHEPRVESEAHLIRLGDVAMVTNQYEYYQDFGLQIKARSKAVQTFVVQLAGPGTYLPTRKATTGKSYGAVPASTPVGPEGGRELVEWSVRAIDAMWA